MREARPCKGELHCVSSPITKEFFAVSDTSTVDARDASHAREIPYPSYLPVGSPQDPVVLRPKQAQMITIAERDGGWECTYCSRPLAPFPVSSEHWEWHDAWWRKTRAGISCPCDQHEPGEWCGYAGSWYPKKGLALGDRDHIIPRSRGGSDDLSNLCLSCGSCNSQKGAKTLAEYVAWKLVDPRRIR